jgi:hypothetical protein
MFTGKDNRLNINELIGTGKWLLLTLLRPYKIYGDTMNVFRLISSIATAVIVTESCLTYAGSNF